MLKICQPAGYLVKSVEKNGIENFKLLEKV